MKENLIKLRNQHEDFKFFLYDDKMCREFIQKHFGPNELYAFDSLIPGAYKADLWRYCVLYIYGGVYMDIKLQCVDGFNLIYLIHEECFPKDIDKGNNKGIWQGFLICKPKNEILKHCINEIIKNVKQFYYGDTCLSITGPGLMYNIVNKYNKEYYENSKLKLKYINNSPTNLGIYYYNKLIIDIYKNYINERNSNGQCHYGVMWKNKCIYNIIYNPINYSTNVNINNIPKYVFQTYSSKNITQNMKNNIITLRQKHTEFEFFLYDDNMCREFIKQHFTNKELYAFDNLIPGAYKADLWRYCVLYIYGGVYMDIKLQTINNFKLIDHIKEECFPLDDINIPACWQGFLI